MRADGRPHFATETGRDVRLLDRRPDLAALRRHRPPDPPPGHRPGPRRCAAAAGSGGGILMRPDGRWALAEVNNQLWVVAVPPFTGAPPAVECAMPRAVAAGQAADRHRRRLLAWADDGKTITWSIGRVTSATTSPGRAVDRKTRATRRGRRPQTRGRRQADTGARRREDRPTRCRPTRAARLEVTTDPAGHAAGQRGAAGRARHHHEGRRGHRERRHRGHRQPDRRVGPRGAGPGSGARSSTSPARPSCRASSTPTRHMWPTWGIHETAGLDVPERTSPTA